jgi:hypothetical protein
MLCRYPNQWEVRHFQCSNCKNCCAKKRLDQVSGPGKIIPASKSTHKDFGSVLSFLQDCYYWNWKMEQRINSAIISEQGKVNRWRENLSSVKSAERLSPQPSPFSFISEFTPGRNPTSVPSVRNPLHSRAHCDVIWKFTRGRNLSAVLSARSPVPNHTTCGLILWGFTLARNPTVVLCATSRLFCQPRW